MTRIRVNIVSARGVEPCSRLLAALAMAFDVDFCAESTPCPVPDAVLEVGADGPARQFGVPTLAYVSTGGAVRAPSAVKFTNTPDVDRPFRGRTLEDQYLPEGGLAGLADDEVAVATVDGDVLWASRPCRGAERHRVAMPFPGLDAGQVLRDIFRPGRFLALLPLAQLLDRLRQERGWRRPESRATILIDDPNLHAVRYGHIDYRSIAEHARAHRYHVAFAMVPLDTWYSSPHAARVFRNNACFLSLLIHGNDHLREELGHPYGADVYASVAAQALRRIDRFERATGLEVARVMAAPHGRCVEAAAIALHRTGYDALCISRPYPWLQAPPADLPLVGWFPADHVVGGLPVLPRYAIAKEAEELVFRAWLGQPLIVYGHHGDARSGYARMAEIAAFVNGLGDMRWQSVAAIARAMSRPVWPTTGCRCGHTRLGSIWRYRPGYDRSRSQPLQ